MLDQKLPMRREPVMALYRKFCMCRLMSSCRMFFQIDASVSSWVVMSWIAYLVMSRFMSVFLV